jgi:hypothetical protein
LHPNSFSNHGNQLPCPAIALASVSRRPISIMSRIGRHLVESEIRAALRAKARGLPLSPHAEAALLWIAWLRRTEGDQAAQRLLAWVVGTSVTVIAWHERIGERTIQNRIDASLDAMRREFSGHNGLGLPGL